ncbi:dUTP diphosphatase [Escherichia phage SKA49]|uniref:dUTP diphosphatase n=1 Tax=Escherichia phage SKA49 TaxID=2910155 RepID=A0A9E6YE88_9CAUD|nr:dUTP diphosphatase [Escherichia phage SKA49]UIU47126.1 dUTP diphosphatase [Escherichia phage SKA49]
MSCMTQVVAVKRVHPNAKLPVYATAGAAAADVCTISDSTVVINPGCSAVFDTGLQFEIPVGYELKVHSRSGHGFKSGIRLANCTGILDSDYRGNLMVKLHNDSDTAFVVQPGERICQVQVSKATQHHFVEVDSLNETARGVGGFGSTGRVEVGQYDPSLIVPSNGSHSHSMSVVGEGTTAFVSGTTSIGTHTRGAERYK